MSETISSNHFSVDIQINDALDYLRFHYPMTYNLIAANFPEVEDLKFQYMGCHFDTEAMGVDQEWPMWVADAIEATGLIHWEEGEPWSSQ